MTTTIDLFRNADEYVVYEPGQTVFEEGQPGDVMYAVIEGEIEVTVKGKLVDRVGPGGIIGEMALIDDSPRHAAEQASARQLEALHLPGATDSFLCHPGHARHGRAAAGLDGRNLITESIGSVT